ncbi:hypothetical protein ATY81_23385 [Rhizobium sp. R72]|nr:hypothetical protein ATY81_23385 [Rhizobium sp. R72]OWW01998.1 hypothetical protein ATY80_23385 [Rhizobium sp. R711]
MDDRLSDLHVRLKGHIAGIVIDQPGWQGAAELAAPCLVEDAAAQPCLDHMQFGFTHCSLETEQKPVVEACRIVDAVLVEDQGVSKGADLEQTLPVGIVARQTGDFQAHDDPGAPCRHR